MAVRPLKWNGAGKASMAPAQEGPYMHEVVAILSRKGKKRLSVMDWIMFPSNPCAEALTLYVACLETEPFKKKVRSPKDGALIQEDWCS